MFDLIGEGASAVLSVKSVLSHAGYFYKQFYAEGF
jgi:hypothetical protein